MPDLRDLFTRAVGDIPEFDAGLLRRAVARRHRRRIAVALAGIVVLTAAGTTAVIASRHKQSQLVTVAPLQQSTTSPSTVAPPTTIPAPALQQLRAALQAWATFPVDASPRPLVLTTDAVSAPSGGFLTTDMKEAFLTGLFFTPTTYPPGPRAVLGYPVISAADALGVLRAEGTPALGAPRLPIPLRITSIRLATAPFGTDRGTHTFPAWLFSFQGVTSPAAVLAVAPSSRFPAPAASLNRGTQLGAQLDPDGRTLTVIFVGAPAGNGPCSAEYAIDQLASKTAVALRVRETRGATGTYAPGLRVAVPSVTSPTPSGVICPDVGYTRRQVIVLAAPLGNRVLVDATTEGPAPIAP